ncbi:MAG: hypothetical protein IPJ32_09115 [Sphingobacteriaceae bacterium]|nr:hypothetical protein [Sphingobacteriaceae bacterium]
MKSKLVYALALIVLSGSLVFTGCKKRKAFKNEDGQTSADSRTAQGESDGAISDANTIISEQPLLHGRGGSPNAIQGVLGTICGLTTNTVNIANGEITLNYDGTTCNNRTRTGSIRLTILNYAGGVRWKHVGAVLQVDYINYKVTRASDGKSVELNGTQNVTNNSGGTWFDLIFLAQANLSHQVTGTNLNVTFDGSKTAVYNINRKFTYTWASPVVTCVGEGIGSSNSLSNLENYGTTRDGDNFTSQVTTPVVWNTTCGAWAPIQGAVNVKVDDKAFDLKCTFGVDANGNSISVAPNTCAYGMKVEWTYKKKTNKKIFGYQ